MPTTDVHLGGNPEAVVRSWIVEFVRDSPSNRLPMEGGGAMFEDPLVAYANGDDPLFDDYKAIIGPFHLTPREAMRHVAGQDPPSEEGALGHISVISWVLPIAKHIRLSNRDRADGPSPQWAYTRYLGEICNDRLRSHMVETLQARGYLAMAPASSELFKVHREGVARPPVSNWSERHIAYAAGLGTFSINDGFITARGIAMRCGSVVTNLPLQADIRSYANHTANCLYLAQGTCGLCIERCPAGAIGPDGHDKAKCDRFVQQCTERFRASFDSQATVAGCGLCQTGVPCEDGIPASS